MGFAPFYTGFSGRDMEDLRANFKAEHLTNKKLRAIIGT
jgi:hypothetical protein